MTANLILTVLVVNLVLPSQNLGHPMIMSNSDQGATSNSGDSIVNSDVQQNFHSLIESVAKSDSKRSEVYRGVLQENVANGQQAFDAMKDEIQITQKRNVNRRRDHVESGMHHSGNVSPVKRVAKEDPLMLEDLFVGKYGNDNETSGMWEFARINRCDYTLLTEVCDQAHSFSKRPDNHIFESRYFANRTLSFRQEKHKPMIVDTIFYAVNYNESQMHTYSIMKGMKSDCVFYLSTPGTEFPPKRFLISDHVCTIQFYKTLHLNSRMLPYMQVHV